LIICVFWNAKDEYLERNHHACGQTSWSTVISLAWLFTQVVNKLFHVKGICGIPYSTNNFLLCVIIISNVKCVQPPPKCTSALFIKLVKEWDNSGLTIMVLTFLFSYYFIQIISFYKLVFKKKNLKIKGFQIMYVKLIIISFKHVYRDIKPLIKYSHMLQKNMTCNYGIWIMCCKNQHCCYLNHWIGLTKI